MISKKSMGNFILSKSKKKTLIAFFLFGNEEWDYYVDNVDKQCKNWVNTVDEKFLEKNTIFSEHPVLTIQKLKNKNNDKKIQGASIM